MLDVLVSGGVVYDGSGDEGRRVDVGVQGDRIVAIGALSDSEARLRLVAEDRAVCPGFVNILSHSYLSILHDPRSMGELSQGVTTQVFGEGISMGPLTSPTRKEIEELGREWGLEVSWTSLAEYLHHVERRGSSQNVASFVAAGTLRANVVGYQDRPATARELDQMRSLVEEAMADGAVGVSSALIYPPGSYAGTEELTALCSAAAKFGGVYSSHLRDEGAGLLGAADELIQICRSAGLPGEIYHLKAAGIGNWPLMEQVLDSIEEARSGGVPVSADVYPYTASATGLTSVIPQRFHAGGSEALYDRLGDPAVRAEIRSELEAAGRFGDVSDAESVLILNMRTSSGRQYQGCTLAKVAAMRGEDPIEAAFGLIAEDRTRVGAAFFSISEDNLRSALLRPWVAVCSDGSSMAPEGLFLKSPTHPREYGSFARVLGRYVREQRLLPLSEAIRRMSCLPATKLGLRDRGTLKEGSFADMAVFDPTTVADRSTFANPHQLSVGVDHVLVNGQLTLSHGQFTGKLAGRALAGPGKLA